jgi:PAS domain-containing protein
MGLETDRKKSEEVIKEANERFERISSATNDAIFELDFSSGKSWHNKVSHDNLNMHDENLSPEENKLLWRSRLHPDDSPLKVLTPVILEPQIHGQMSFAFKIRWHYGNFTNARYYKGRSGEATRFIGSMLDVTDLKSRRRIQECE